MHCSRGGVVVVVVEGGRGGWMGRGEEMKGFALHLCESQDISALVKH